MVPWLMAVPAPGASNVAIAPPEGCVTRGGSFEGREFARRAPYEGVIDLVGVDVESRHRARLIDASREGAHRARARSVNHREAAGLSECRAPHGQTRHKAKFP